MRTSFFFFFFFFSTVALLLSAATAAAAPATAPSAAPATRPASPNRVRGADLGVNIHFTRPSPGEVKMMADAGVSVVRMDFTWASTERRAGEYDFAAYDGLLAALDEHAVRAIFILDYGNPLYDGGLSPHTDTGRAAFAKWAAAAVAHFKGRNVIWEMWNEPNGSFWKPKADAGDYAKLAVETGRAIRAVDSSADYVGPATSEIDLPFLEACFRAGCLEYWSAVSVHPYRQAEPESAAAEYRALRRLIAKYAPKDPQHPNGKPIPIYSGEWGYSSAWKDYGEDRQGLYLPRQWLTNLANDVPVSVWYDWHDDGADAKEPEHHFGTTRHERAKGGATTPGQLWEPKPAYRAMKALTDQLGGFAFSKRLAVGDYDKDYVLLFAKTDEQGKATDVRLAVWTTAGEPRELAIPALAGLFRRTGHLGQPLAQAAAASNGIRVIARPDVQYLAPAEPDALLLVAASWTRPFGPGPQAYRGGRICIGTSVRNDTPKAFQAAALFDGGFGVGEAAIPPGDERTLASRTYLPHYPPTQVHALYLRTNLGPAVGQWAVTDQAEPSEFAVVGAEGDDVDVMIRLTGQDPAHRAVVVSVELSDGRAGSAKAELVNGRSAVVRVSLGGARVTTRSSAGGSAGGGPAESSRPTVAVRLTDDDPDAAANPAGRHAQLAALPLARYASLPFPAAAGDLPLKAVPDGDRKVKSEQSVRQAAPPEGPPAEGLATFELAYQFEAGHKFVQLVPARDDLRPLPGRPRELRLWAFGDGSGNPLRARFVGADGQVFQASAGRLDWTGWRLVAFPLDGTHAGHWAGKDDGVVRHPLKLDSLLLIDSAHQQPTGGKVYVAGPMVVE